MLGQLSWTFFASSAGMSTGAVVDSAGMLKACIFPGDSSDQYCLIQPRAVSAHGGGFSPGDADLVGAVVGADAPVSCFLALRVVFTIGRLDTRHEHGVLRDVGISSRWRSR
jgi:hypothetical protein